MWPSLRFTSTCGGSFGRVDDGLRSPLRLGRVCGSRSIGQLVDWDPKGDVFPFCFLFKPTVEKERQPRVKHHGSVQPQQPHHREFLLSKHRKEKVVHARSESTLERDQGHGGHGRPTMPPERTRGTTGSTCESKTRISINRTHTCTIAQPTTRGLQVPKPTKLASCPCR